MSFTTPLGVVSGGGKNYAPLPIQRTLVRFSCFWSGPASVAKIYVCPCRIPRNGTTHPVTCSFDGVSRKEPTQTCDSGREQKSCCHRQRVCLFVPQERGPRTAMTYVSVCFEWLCDGREMGRCFLRMGVVAVLGGKKLWVLSPRWRRRRFWKAAQDTVKLFKSVVAEIG